MDLALFDHPGKHRTPRLIRRDCRSATDEHFSTIPPHDNVRLQFRAYVHEGITPEAEVESHYQCYAKSAEG